MHFSESKEPSKSEAQATHTPRVWFVTWMSAKEHDIHCSEVPPQYPHLEKANQLVLFAFFRKDDGKCHNKLCHGSHSFLVEKQFKNTRKEDFPSNYVHP